MLQEASSENLLNKRDAAKVLRVSERTVDNWVKNGRLPHVKLGFLVRFIPHDLAKFIESQRIG